MIMANAMNDVLIINGKATALARTLQRFAIARGGYGFDALEPKWSARAGVTFSSTATVRDSNAKQ